MGLFKSKPPEPPDPDKLAADQLGMNVNMAIANQAMNMMNQVTPYGSLTYEPAGMTSYTDPATGQTFQIPRYTAVQQLSPAQQQILDMQQGRTKDLYGLTDTMLSNLGDRLSTPFTLSGPGSGPAREPAPMRRRR